MASDPSVARVEATVLRTVGPQGSVLELLLPPGMRVLSGELAEVDRLLDDRRLSIRAGDYLFDADVTGAGSTVTFTNSSDNQFHHVILIDFGTNDPALVEAFLPALLESEGEAPPPEGIDSEQVNEFASSSMFGPGSSGTFEAPFDHSATCRESPRFSERSSTARLCCGGGRPSDP
jgi:hypothetical protein